MTEEMSLPSPRGAAPFRWQGYPGTPLLGARRSIAGMIGVFAASTVLLIVFVGAAALLIAETSPPQGLQAIIQLVAYGLAYGSWLLIAGMGRRRAGVSFSEWVALRPFSWGPGLAAAAVSMSLALGFYIAFASVITVIGIEPPQQPTVIDIFPVTPLGIAIAFVSVCIVGPLGEEVLFRGVVFGGMRDRIGEPWAVVISAVLFSAAHASWFVFVPFLVFGVLLARITSQTRSVWPAFVAHALFNLNSLLLTYLAYFLGATSPAWTASVTKAIAVLLQ